MNIHNLTRCAIAACAATFLTSAAFAQSPADVPAAGESAKIDAIKERGALRVAAIGEFPWLPESTTGSGPQFSGPAWVLAEEYAERLGVSVQVVPVSHETKVPILATGEADITIAPLAVTPAREEVVDFIVYSRSSLCLFGLASNPKLEGIDTVDGLDSDDITIAYFTGTPPETWAPTRFPNATLKGVAGSGANAPIEEIMARRADVAPIDNVAWPRRVRQVPGLVSFPAGDECLQSEEMSTAIGIAVDKGDAIFRDWLQAVYEDAEDKVTQAELDLLKADN